jgi:archaellum component FlaG (FlaF/FlaG flagellin family)
MKFQKMSKVTITVIALVIAGLFLTLTTAAILSNQTVPLNGTINAVNLGVYSDSACTQTATALNVGALNPGTNATQTIYIKNTGNIAETLTMTTNNWNPTGAGTTLTLTWNRQNTVLPAGQSIQATLTLTAASNTGTITTFSCDVTLTGTQ